MGESVYNWEPWEEGEVVMEEPKDPESTVVQSMVKAGKGLNVLLKNRMYNYVGTVNRMR